MEDMARFRNLLVHLYWEIDHERIYDEMGERIETLDRFVKEILMLLYYLYFIRKFFITYYK